METSPLDVIYLTGFGPFGPYEINPSWEIVKLASEKYETFLQGDDISSWIWLEKLGKLECTPTMVTEELPVLYQPVKQSIQEKCLLHKPKVAIHVGVSGMTDCFLIETCARRRRYRDPDMENCFPPQDEFIKRRKCVRTDLDCEHIRSRAQELAKSSFGIELSRNAGRYLCEYAYYQSLMFNTGRSLFVHCPELTENREEGAATLLAIVLASLELKA